jgi:hypothetical protein
MNRKLQNYFFKKYEPLYVQHGLTMQETCMCWGMDCGDGWARLIDVLSWQLCGDWVRAKQRHENLKGKVGQLKFPSSPPSSYNTVITAADVAAAFDQVEKARAEVPQATQVKEKFGALCFYVSGATDAQYAAISFAEHMSAITCDVCGNRGKINRGGWLKCRCKKHQSL